MANFSCIHGIITLTHSSMHTSVWCLQTSMLFDVRFGGDFDGQITYFQPVLAPLPLEQAVFELG